MLLHSCMHILNIVHVCRSHEVDAVLRQIQDVFCSTIKRFGQQIPPTNSCCQVLLSVLLYTASNFKMSIPTKADTRLSKLFDDIFYHIERYWIEKHVYLVFGGAANTPKYFTPMAKKEMQVCIQSCYVVIDIFISLTMHL